MRKKKKHVDLSRRIISKLGLEDRIRILNQKGEYLNNNNYSTIIIALLAKPKIKIIERILKNTSPGIKIVCRTSDSIRRAFYESTDPSILNGFKIISKKYATKNQTISSLLMKKKQSSIV